MHSGDLVTVDVDAPEAVRLAPKFLPPTGLLEGLPGKPRSRWRFRVANLSARPHGFGRVRRSGCPSPLLSLQRRAGRLAADGSPGGSGWLVRRRERPKVAPDFFKAVA
jgi:hypothetical protein